MIEKLIAMASGLVTILAAFKKKPNNFMEITEAGGTPLQPESEPRVLNKNEIVGLEKVPWGEVGKAVIVLRNGEKINVEEAESDIYKKLS